MEKIRNFFSKHQWIQHVILMIGIVVVLGLLFFLIIKLYTRQGKEYAMPSFADSTKTVAEASAANDLDLEFVILDSVYIPGVKPGAILVQDPKAGTMIKKGRKVYVSVATSIADKLIMPELSGLSVRQAVSEIYNSGLQVGRLTFDENYYKDNVKEPRVNGRIIYAGQKVSPGTVIDLVVGSGSTSGSVLVPFLIGKNAAQAHRDIYSVSLNVGREHFEGVKDKATAVVYRQEPDYNGVNKYPFGTVIELWYKNASDEEVTRMITDFKVDSSKIIVDEPPEVEDDWWSDDVDDIRKESEFEW